MAGVDSLVPNVSGIIDQTKGLDGPAIVLSLQPLVNPPADSGKAYIIWTPYNAWLSTQDFKGPFYLKDGERLIGRNDFTGIGVMYSAYKT